MERKGIKKKRNQKDQNLLTATAAITAALVLLIQG
jgi:hypothetical protein